MTNNDRLSEAAQLYVGIIILAGILAVLHSLYSLLHSQLSYHWFVLAGLTLLSGSFTVRIPTIPARLSVSETFVFATVLLFGPAAATIIVVLDCLVISLWLGQRSRRPSRVLFNMAAPSVAIWISAHIFYWLAAVAPLSQSPRPILTLLVPLLTLAVLYFLLNSLLIAWAVAFETRASAITIWRQNFMWLSLNYFSGASVAALLLPYLQQGQSQFVRVIGVLLPLLLISYLTFKTALGRVDDANRHLNELNRLYLSTIETLAMAIDAKDQITHGHIRRVQTRAVQLAKAMGVTSPAQIQAIEAAALLHDMGKLAVPEYILNKPGPLTPAEFEKMKLHASVGADILSAIDFPYPVVPIVRHHHESWDGSGYPDGLVGASIPIGARILSVVDCFDALTSDRPYRPRLSDKDALTILVDRRGRMYDPLVVDTFLRVHGEGAPQTTVTQADAPLNAIAESSFPSRQPDQVGDSRLDEIAASGSEMLALFELARGLSGPKTLQDVGDMVLKHLRRMVPFSLSVIYVHDFDTEDLVATHASGEHCGLVTGLRIPLGQRLTGWVGANRQTIRNSDPVLDLGESARSMAPRPRSCLSTPLTVNGELVAVLSLYSSTREAFTEEHQRIVEVVGRQVAPVVQHALAFGKNTRETHRDQLADLPSAARLQAFGRSQGGTSDGQTQMALIYVDVIGTRSPNSSLGRDVIDRVLNHVVACIRKVLRPADILFRPSANDFVIVLPQSDKTFATNMAEQIRQVISSQPAEGLTYETIAFELGVSAVPQDGDSIDQLVAAARSRLAASNEVPPELQSRPPESIH